MTTPETTNETLVRQDYKYGFVTAIEADTVPPGLLSPEVTFEILDSLPADAPIVVYSNQGNRSLERASHLRFTPATDATREFTLTDERAIVNVGSVGQPRDGDTRASFAVVDDRRVEIHRVPYDFRGTQRKILAAGRCALPAAPIVVLLESNSDS